MRVGDDRHGQLDFGVGERGRVGQRREIRHRIVGGIEAVGIDMAEIGDRGVGARIGLAVGDPERRVVAAGIERVDLRAVLLAADDVVEFAVGEIVQLVGDRARSGRGRRRGSVSRRRRGRRCRRRAGGRGGVDCRGGCGCPVPRQASPSAAAGAAAASTVSAASAAGVPRRACRRGRRLGAGGVGRRRGGIAGVCCGVRGVGKRAAGARPRAEGRRRSRPEADRHGCRALQILLRNLRNCDRKTHTLWEDRSPIMALACGHGQSAETARTLREPGNFVL